MAELPMRILSIDGGGIRGVVPATIMVALETLTGRQAIDLFDGFVGTSTGGILALGLCCPTASGRPRSAELVRALYLDGGPAIFPRAGLPARDPPGWLERRLWGNHGKPPPGLGLGRALEHVFRPEAAETFNVFIGQADDDRGNARYPAAPLEQALQAEFGETLLSQALRPVSVLSCDFQRGTPVIFRGGGLDPGLAGDAPMRTAARATSAAPTYFPALGYRTTTGDVICVDGGLIANDPAMIGYAMAFELGARNAEDVVLISLGTGEPEQPEGEDLIQITASDGAWRLLRPVMNGYSVGAGHLAREMLASMLGLAYRRLQPKLGAPVDPGMDNAAPGNITALKAAAEAYVARESRALDEIAQLVAR